MTEPMIVVDNLSKTFHAGRPKQTVTALDAVSLTVAPGSCLAVVGESGSGKTTLARIIVGLETADAGVVTVGGRVVAPRANRAELKRRARSIQMVFQDPQSSLNRRLPVRTAIDEVLQAHTRLGRRERDAGVPSYSRLSDFFPSTVRHFQASCPAGNGSVWPSRGRSPPTRQ